MHITKPGELLASKLYYYNKKSKAYRAELKTKNNSTFVKDCKCFNSLK